MKLRNFANTDSPEFPPTVHLLSTPRSIHLTHFPSLVHTHSLLLLSLLDSSAVLPSQNSGKTHTAASPRDGGFLRRRRRASQLSSTQRGRPAHVSGCLLACVCVCVPARRAPEKKNQFNQMSQYLDHPLEAGPPRTPNTQQRRVKTKAGRKVLRD